MDTNHIDTGALYTAVIPLPLMGEYLMLKNARDLWTPARQINLLGSSTINISGSVYDEWHASVNPGQQLIFYCAGKGGILSTLTPRMEDTDN